MRLRPASGWTKIAPGPWIGERNAEGFCGSDAVPDAGGGAQAQAPMTITPPDRDVFLKNVTTLTDGTVIIGAMLQPYIYRARPARRWRNAGSVFPASGSASRRGPVADNSCNTLWVCTTAFTLPAKITPAIKERHTTLRAFDTNTGAAKGAWPLLGQTNSCNDMTVAADGTVYRDRHRHGEIQRLRPGAAALEARLKVPELANRRWHRLHRRRPSMRNNVATNKLFRIPINANGSAG